MIKTVLTYVARRTRWQRFGLSAAVACAIVALAARELHSLDPSRFARVVLAPVPWVVALVPSPDIGTTEQSVYEGTPIHIGVAVAAVPLVAIAYTALGYLWLTLIGRRDEGV